MAELCFLAWDLGIDHQAVTDTLRNTSGFVGKRFLHPQVR